jgi:hypothetical protein
MIYTVYILYSKDYDKIYIGYTSNLIYPILSRSFERLFHFHTCKEISFSKACHKSIIFSNAATLKAFKNADLFDYSTLLMIFAVA